MKKCFPVAWQLVLLEPRPERLHTCTHFIIIPGRPVPFAGIVRTGTGCARRGGGGTAGSMMVCVIEMKKYPRYGFSSSSGLQFSNGLRAPPRHSPTAGADRGPGLR